MDESSQSRIGWNPPAPEEIDALFEQYEVFEMIGRGGMGAVYRGIQTSLERSVAIKILPPEFGKQIDFAERFRREALAMAKLEHPNVVHIYDFGNAGEIYYLVMEFVEGTDLRDLIRSGTLDPRTALEVVSLICDALQYAHDLGYIHRDIKPANIFLSKSGSVKVGDFGLAKLIDEDWDPNLPSLTLSGYRVGTPQYMSPEARGADDSKIDHRSDIYSLGVMLYEMLTGSLPEGAFPPPSKKAAISSKLDDVVIKSMRPEPADRYESASQLKKEVDDISTKTRRIKTKDGLLRGSQKQWVIGILSLLAVIGCIFWIATGNRKKEIDARDLNLLGDVNVYRDVFKGQMDLKGGELTKRSKDALLQFPHDLTENFDLRFDFTQTREMRDIVWSVPIQGRVLSMDLLVIWSESGYRGGIGMLDGVHLFTPGRQAAVETNPFSVGNRHSATLQVRTKDNVVDARVFTDGQPHFQWQGEVERLPRWDKDEVATRTQQNMFETFEDSLGPRLFLSSGGIEIHEIRAQTGPYLAALPANQPNPSGPIITPEDGWVRCNESIDINKDVLVGVWRKSDQGVIQNKYHSDHARLRVPVRVNGSYEIRVQFTHHSMEPNFHGWKLPISTGSIGFRVQERQNRWAHGLYDSKNEFAPLDQPWVLPNTAYTVLMKVVEKDDELHFSSELNGRKTNEWNGSVDEVFNHRLNDPNYFMGGDSDQPCIVVRKGEVDFKSIEIRMLEGTATFIRPQ